MSSSHKPLSGRVALVTGVSRSQGIGYATALRLGNLGASLFLHGFASYDRSVLGIDSEGTESVANQLRKEGLTVSHTEADFRDADAPKRVMDEAPVPISTLTYLLATMHTAPRRSALLQSPQRKLTITSRSTSVQPSFLSKHLLHSTTAEREDG